MTGAYSSHGGAIGIDSTARAAAAAAQATANEAISLFEAPFSAIAAANLLAGQPVYMQSSGHLALADATDHNTTSVCGLVTADTLTGFVANVTDRQFTLSDWTAVTGSATLILGAKYYLGLTSGMLSTIAPTASGQTVVLIGKAVSTTMLEIMILQPILL